jgi:hypothetical protein
MAACSRRTDRYKVLWPGCRNANGVHSLLNEASLKLGKSCVSQLCFPPNRFVTQRSCLQGPRSLRCGGLGSKAPEGDCHTSGIGRQVRCFCFAPLTCPALHQVESRVPQWWIYHLDGGRSCCKYMEWSSRVIAARACMTMARRSSVWPMDQVTSQRFCTFSVPPLS